MRGFDLDSLTSTYPIVMRLQGKQWRVRDSLFIEIDSGLIHSNVPRSIGARGVVTRIDLTIGLG